MTEAATYLNFAYGSNMSITRLRRRTPSARIVEIGRLPGHDLRWHKRSKDGSGKCDALATSNDSHVIWGAVVEIAERERHLLDRAEGLGSGYEEKWITVETRSETLTAQMYYATHIDPALRPYQWYKAYVLHGAKELELPEAYIERIAGIEAGEDPDLERTHRNRIT